jgi:hypothetical protein
LPAQGGQVPPSKKVKQIDAIFAHLLAVREQAASDRQTLRLSLDTKATVLICLFSRGGQSRTGTRGADHDFRPDGTLTPFGFFRSGTSESALFFTDSNVTSEFMADCLEQWLAEPAQVWKNVRTLVLDLHKGPKTSGQRSQRLLRMVPLAQRYGGVVVLAYYPPHHSKYHPMERLWGILENYWL